GIRDGHVTGVQTCALPISRRLVGKLLELEAALEPASDVPVGARLCEKLRVSLTIFAGEDGFSALLGRAVSLSRSDYPLLEMVRRSEERRVGKEWRCAWSRE